MKATTAHQRALIALAAYRKAADDHLIAVRGLPTYRALADAERAYFAASLGAVNAENKTKKAKP